MAIKESMQQHEWLIERQQLLERIKELEAENTELRKRLGEDVTPTEKKPTAMQNLSLQEKVDLFRSLFKGREDVFARLVLKKVGGNCYSATALQFPRGYFGGR